MPTHSITEFDLFFLSYDEPNADLHWAELLEQAPWAKRVHGVTGFDAAHRACAEQSETDWFVTVDADNKVLPEFFNISIDIDPARPNRCFSWNAVNRINGLMYGNGGLKLWSKRFVLGMQSHENASDPRKAVDFCWEDDYRQVHQTFSEVWPNGSAYQAFRSGFREAVKLTLDRGERVRPEDMKARLHPVNLRNLRIWSSVGADVDNGLWAMVGTRIGWVLMCDPEWDYTRIRDYIWFKDLWAQIVAEFGGESSCKALGRPCATNALTQRLRDDGEDITRMTRISLPMLGPAESEFFRETFQFRND